MKCEKSIFRALLRYKNAKKREREREKFGGDLGVLFWFFGAFFGRYKWDKRDVKSEVYRPSAIESKT